jgi:hypothetical protein
MAGCLCSRVGSDGSPNGPAEDAPGWLFSRWLRFDAVLLIGMYWTFIGIISISFSISIEKSDG